MTNPNPPNFSLDDLMDEDPLNLSTDPKTEGGRKLDAIIAYHRQLRAKEGAEPKVRGKVTSKTIDIKGLLKGMVKSADEKPKVAPSGTGVRRI